MRPDAGTADTRGDGARGRGRSPFAAVPAVDLKGGRCVQLVGGRPDEERVSLPDPVAVALGWREKGFRVIHVVDLDAALGAGDQIDLVGEIARRLSARAEDGGPESPSTGAGELQVGGGIRSDERAAAVLDAGADRIIVGTRAVDDPGWLAALARRHPGRVVVAADVRDGKVLRKGWTESAGLQVMEFVGTLAGLPLAGVLCTDVGREGQVKGIERPGVEAVLTASTHPVWISGGVSTLEELRFLQEKGAAGAVLGMALYTGALDADRVAAEFGGDPAPSGRPRGDGTERTDRTTKDRTTEEEA